MDLRSLDWYRWMMAMLDFEGHPHSSSPYVHTGFNTVVALVYKHSWTYAVVGVLEGSESVRIKIWSTVNGIFN